MLPVAALALGMRHALDPDHLVAVSTLVAEERRLWPAARLGLIWGLGHLLPLALVGLPMLLLRIQLPETMDLAVDLGVGLLLVGLGVRTLWRLRQERAHFHLQGSKANRGWLLAFGIGAMHGLAGSGPAAVLAVTATAPSLVGAFYYLLAFGLGTCLGMLAMTLCIAAPALASASRFETIHRTIRIGAGLASVSVGLMMWYEILPQLLA